MKKSNMKIGCFIYADAENEDKMSAFLRMGTWAANSFTYFHSPQEIEMIAGTFWELGGHHNNLRSDTPFKNLRERCPDTYDWHLKTYTLHNRQQNIWGINKFKIAEELIRREEFDKLIVLGADTITCARLDHFLREYPCFNCAYTDVDVIITPDIDKQFPANPDVICFNAKKTAEGMRSKALTCIVEQWDKDFNDPEDDSGDIYTDVNGRPMERRKTLEYGEMMSLRKVLTKKTTAGSKDHINKMPVPNVFFSYNANKHIDVWVGKDFELINHHVPDQVTKLYVYHMQCGFGIKPSSSTIYNVISSAVWHLPIFGGGEVPWPERYEKNREFFKTVTGDSDMFDLVVEPGLSTERVVGTASGNII